MARIKGQKPLTDTEKRDIIQRYAEGETLRALGTEYHRNMGTIRSVVTAAGLQIKVRGFSDPRVNGPALAARGYVPLTDNEKQNIIDRYNNGEPLSVLCKEYQRGKHTLQEILTNVGVTLRPRGYIKGTVWHDEWRKAHYESTQTDEFRQKSRDHLLRILPRLRGMSTNTPIERRLHDALIKMSIGFRTQPKLLDHYLVDILLYQAPIVIEADGIQHAFTGARKADAIRDANLTAAGYKVFRFTGSEINSDADACIKRVIDECELISEQHPRYDIVSSWKAENHPNWKGGSTRS
jgi:very-short-patch-repair endonuclease